MSIVQIEDLDRLFDYFANIKLLWNTVRHPYNKKELEGQLKNIEEILKTLLSIDAVLEACEESNKYTDGYPVEYYKAVILRGILDEWFTNGTNLKDKIEFGLAVYHRDNK